jgi:hypothetical protein
MDRKASDHRVKGIVNKQTNKPAKKQGDSSENQTSTGNPTMERE